MKNKKNMFVFLLSILIIAIFMFVIITPSIMAEEKVGIPSTAFPSMGTPDQTVTGITDKIWGTVLTIAQILAFAAIVFAGIRYMFASADKKADIKNGLIYLLIGAILVFATSTVVKIAVSTTKEIAPKSINQISYNIVKSWFLKEIYN